MRVVATVMQLLGWILPYSPAGITGVSSLSLLTLTSQAKHWVSVMCSCEIEPNPFC